MIIIAIASTILVMIIGTDYLVHNRKRPVVLYSNTKQQALFDYLSASTKPAIRAKLTVSIGIACLLFFVFLVQMYTANDGMILPALIILIGSVCAIGIGVFAMRLTHSFSAKLYPLLTEHPQIFYRQLISRGRHMICLIMGVALLTFFCCYELMEWCLTHDILGLKTYFERLLTTLSNQMGDYDFYTNYYENRGIMGFFLLLFSVGYFIQTVVTRIFSSFFGSASDIATDISSHIELDYFEDDLRNPGIITDQVGDILKKGYATIHIIMAFFLLIGSLIIILNAQNILFHSDHLLSNHILSGFFILIIPIGVAPFVHRSGLYTTVTTYAIKRLHFQSQIIAALVMGLFVYGIALLGGISMLTVPIVLMGQLTFIACVIIVFRHFQTILQTKESGSIFNLIFQGEVKGIQLTLGIGLCFCLGIMAMFLILNTIASTALGILGFLYFACGFMIQMVIAFFDYFGLIMVDNIEAVGLMTQESSQTVELIGECKRYEVILNTIIKSAIVCISIILSIALFSYFYTRIRFMLYQTDSPMIQNMNYLDLDINALNNMFNMSASNPEFILGMILGGGVLLGVVGVLIKGAYQIYSSIRLQITKNVGELADQPEEKNPDYQSVITMTTRLAKKWTIILIATIIISPYLSARLFGLAGLAGFFISCFPITLILDMVYSNSGNTWHFIKLLKTSRDDMNVESIDYTNRTNQIFCDNLGDLRKDLIGGTLSIIVVFILVIAITIIPLAIRSESFINLL